MMPRNYLSCDFLALDVDSLITRTWDVKA